MDKRIIGIILAVLAISLIAAIAGCGGAEEQENVAPVSKSPGSSEPAASNTATTTASAEPEASKPAPASFELSSEEEQKVMDKLTGGTKVAVSTPYKIISVGDTYVFALGITNIFPRTEKFRIDMHLKDAKTTGGLANNIDTDSTIQSWFANNKFAVKELESGDQVVIPIVLTVGDYIRSGINTIPGSYNFEIVVEYEESNQFWEVYDPSETLITLKVKE